MAHSALESVAQAEDTYNLLEHIAWTDVVKPKLLRIKEENGRMLVNHLLGTPLANGLTKEQVAGQIYGIDFIIRTFEQILAQGKKALVDLEASGVHIQI